MGHITLNSFFKNTIYIKSPFQFDIDEVAGVLPNGRRSEPEHRETGDKQRFADDGRTNQIFSRVAK